MLAFKKLTNRGGFDIVLSMNTRRILLFFLICCIPLQGYCFWIWSPKTQKWKNPKYSALAAPYLQYRQGVEEFEAGNYSQAYAEFKKLLSHYPDAKEAADAQYYLGRCLQEMGKPYQAFLEYKKVIDSYPNSQQIGEVVKQEYEIGEWFLNREPKKWLGVSVYDFVEHPAIEIFKTIIDKSPYSEYAPKAQYKLGLLFFKLGRYEEAREAFQEVIDNYPASEWAAPSKYQLAIATSKFSGGADYDSSAVKEATQQLDEFLKSHPDAQISQAAEQQLDELREREAQKNFEIAQFYEKQKKVSSAKLYYQAVVDKYPESSFAESSRKKLQELKEQE
jgi:outer membrane protein assembly factor BamD (BamD/ComL family)